MARRREVDSRPIGTCGYAFRFEKSEFCTCEMLEAQLDQAVVLKRIVDALKDLVELCYLNCNSDGITIKAIDNGYIALVNLVLREDGFVTYQCPEPTVVGVNIKALHKVLKCAQNDDTVILRCDTEAAENLTLIFQSPDRHRVSNFTLRLMEIDARQFQIPDTDYAATVQMAAAEFQRIVRDMASLGDSLAIRTSKAGVRFSVRETEGTSGEVFITPEDDAYGAEDSDDGDAVRTVVQAKGGETDLTFSVRYLLIFTKATPLSDRVKLEMTEGIPISVTYPIPGKGHISYALAPKADGADDDESSSEVSDSGSEDVKDAPADEFDESD
eukprot:gnl/Chilomastix_cuspidata/699.p2 GENE.gnl/Chilomastix_cuspidata/699~~gnl/Chilomastix_cuspidata/699.p2  ORF type:complete len:328 (-),score=170.61 gnl/Chilomastix_cuspidata/699:78-1061(-)